MGRLFTRRLITLTTKVKKLHHRIRLSSEARADISWWKSFLPTWNGTAMFVNTTATAAVDLHGDLQKMPLEPTAVELTMQVLGFITTGHHLRGYPSRSQYSGRNSLLSWLLRRHGDTTGSKRRFSFTATTSLLSKPGKGKGVSNPDS